MVKRIALVLVGATLVFALLSGLSGLAFAQSQNNGQPCPPECVSDSMEIVTWYPSPYNEYEELRLYPKRSSEESQCITFEQVGLMYYNQDEQVLKVCRFDSVAGYRWELVSYWKLDNNGNISNANSSGKVIAGALQLSSGAQADYVLTSDASGNASWKSSSASAGARVYTCPSIASSSNCSGSSCVGQISLTTSSCNYYNYEQSCGTQSCTMLCNYKTASCEIAGQLLKIQTLMGKAHTAGDCRAIGTTVNSSGQAVSNDSDAVFCKVSGTSCPGGWTTHSNWSTTSSVTCETKNDVCGCSNNSCSTGAHLTFSDATTETCNYITHFTAGLGWCNGCGNATCKATVTSVGCY